MIPPRPTPKLKVGDVILWRGWRDRGETTDYVFDHIVEVTVGLIQRRNMWEIYYRTEKQYGFEEDQLAQPVRTGHLNFAGRMGSPGLHNDRLESALQFHREDFGKAVDWLAEIGFPIHPRMGLLYPHFRKLHYARTWTSTGASTKMYKLTPAQAEVLAFISTAPTREMCLAMVGGWDYRQRQPYPLLDKAFEYNEYQHWAGIVDFDLEFALRLLAQASDDEIIDKVLDYRRSLLSGDEATGFHRAETLKWLFPVDGSKATGSWPRSVLAWIKEQGIRPSSGKTRLHRVYKAAISAGDEMDNLNASDFLRVWQDKKVVAVVAGKGGVGKSTVAADLARSVARSGQRVFLADFDMHGPSQHKYFPLPEGGIKTENGLMVPPQVDGVDVMSFGYLVRPDEAVTHRGPFLASLIHLAALYTKVEADVVILDMPPGTGDVLQHVQEICPTANYLMVATASTIATPDVQRAITALNTGNRQRVIGVVDNMAYIEVDGVKQPMWGSPDDVQVLAHRNSLRYLGALPFFPWSEAGSDEARIAATEKLLLPVVEKHLAVDIPYQDVTDFETLVNDAAQRLVTQIQDRRFGGVSFGWGIDNIAGFLEAPIIDRGGNPNQQQYQEVLVREASRVWETHGNKVLTHTPSAGLDGSRWWHQIAIEKSAA